jgi:hypothetical protein
MVYGDECLCVTSRTCADKSVDKECHARKLVCHELLADMASFLALSHLPNPRPASEKETFF